MHPVKQGWEPSALLAMIIININNLNIENPVINLIITRAS